MSLPNYQLIDKDLTNSQLQLTLALSFSEDSGYFDGHFPQLAILPAVAQLFVVQRIAEAEFGALGKFSELSQVKFKALIHPNQPLVLRLDYARNSGVLSFSYALNEAVVSSGKLKYQGKQS